MIAEPSAKLSLIVCAARNGTIGRGGLMPWRMPSDLKFFKATTLGKPVIMGRKTFEAIGKPLPGRLNIVVTRQPGLAIAGVLVVLTLDAAIAAASEYLANRTDAEIMVIGGGEIYRQALPLADRVYLTRLEADIAGDATFPTLDSALWQEKSSQPLPASASDDHAAIVIIYDRRKTVDQGADRP